MAKKQSKTVEVVERFVIPRVEMALIQIPIRGLDGPLVVNNWTEKAVGQMLAKQLQLDMGPLQPKDPEQAYNDSMHVSTDGTYGFPAGGFKKCIERAVKPIPNLDMIEFRQIVFVVPDCREDRIFHIPLRKNTGNVDKAGKMVRELVVLKHRMTCDLVEIIGEPRMRMDMVRIGMGKTDVRFRAEFPEWRAVLTLRYVVNRIGPEQLLNLVNLAGNTVGVGEGRPEKKDMGWGRFELDLEKIKEMS